MGCASSATVRAVDVSPSGVAHKSAVTASTGGNIIGAKSGTSYRVPALSAEGACLLFLIA